MKKYQELVQKFLDKGYAQELHWLVVPPPAFELGRLIGDKKEQYQTFLSCVERVYGKDWDYWNAWIDTKLPK